MSKKKPELPRVAHYVVVGDGDVYQPLKQYDNLAWVHPRAVWQEAKATCEALEKYFQESLEAEVLGGEEEDGE